MDEKRRELVSLKRIEGIKEFGGLSKMVVTLAGIGLSVFSLYTAAFGLFTPLEQRPIHLCFILIMCLLSYSSRLFNARSGMESILNLILVIIATVSIVWLLFS